MDNFAEKIKTRLQKPLPGPEAQLRMASLKKVRAKYGMEIPGNAKPSGILILLYPKNGSVYTILIRRQKYPGVHSGQISFPGGRREKSDANLVETALREAEEEVGVKASDVEIVGNLTRLYIPPSNFCVLPSVGWINYVPRLKKEISEVDEIIPIDINNFTKNEFISKEKVMAQSSPTIVPCYRLNGLVIWGATAMMISEFSEILRTM